MAQPWKGGQDVGAMGDPVAFISSNLRPNGACDVGWEIIVTILQRHLRVRETGHLCERAASAGTELAPGPGVTLSPSDAPHSFSWNERYLEITQKALLPVCSFGANT